MNDNNTPQEDHPLGLDYMEITDPTLREQARQAEAQWLQNAVMTYGHDTPEIWAGDIFPRIVTQTLEMVDLEDISRYCPDFLERVAP